MCVIATLLRYGVKNECFSKVEMSRHLRRQKNWDETLKLSRDVIVYHLLVEIGILVHISRNIIFVMHISQIKRRNGYILGKNHNF